MNLEDKQLEFLPRLANGTLAGTVPAWLTRQQVANYLQVSLKTLDRGLVAGGNFNLLARKKVGRAVRFKTRSVVEFADKYIDV